MRSFAIMNLTFCALLAFLPAPDPVTLQLEGELCCVQDTAIPGLNQRVVDFAKSKMGKKVGAGECWDLAAEALNTAGARWDGLYGFGELVDWRTAEVHPGDIVQFENVDIERREGATVRRERYGHHTAVIMDVRDKGDYVIAHQNMQGIGRKVGLGDLVMGHVRGGKLLFYRPVE